ncbi:MAG: SpoIID/LytB domain-containing protein [Candidatus Velthaea sp.]|jgi:stage II sporulation protein D
MTLARGEFLAGGLALFSGGLDVWSTPAPGSLIRILVSGDRAGAAPEPFDAQSFRFAGTRYRGRPGVVRLPNGREAVIASVDVEDYLYGVIGLEVSPGWPPAALRAQAIVARTYALEHRTLGRPYDVTMDESDQRYGGLGAESPATIAAVEATRGQRLGYAGGPASVYYASCCGGHTADAVEFWSHVALPYLRGVACPYCTAAPDYRWRRSVALDRVTAALAGRIGGRISGFALGPADASGRPRTVDVLAQTERVTLTCTEFRRLLGADVVRSTWLRSVNIDSSAANAGGQAGPQVVIEGCGRGHGVGLCQWGARGMSVAGATDTQILAFYFPGTALARG